MAQISGAIMIGVNELKQTLKGMEKALNRKEFIDGCEKAARLIKNQAQANVRRRIKPKSRLLMRSFLVRRLKPTKSKTAGAAAAVWKKPMIVGSKGASYAHMLEYGTINISPIHFFRDAVDDNKERAKSHMTGGAKKAIENFAKTRAGRHAILFRQF